MGIQNEEGKRLQLFMERENLTQDELAAIVGKSQSDVNRYIKGKYAIPLSVVKTLHLKCQLNYTWFFHGTGTLKAKAVEKRNIMTDLVDIHAALGIIMASQEDIRKDVNQLAKTVYANKHNI
jgi:transcriptional regulator with XRE-family HTH domain